jgi:hypothetical protein
LRLKQAELASEAFGVGRLEAGAEGVDCFTRILDRDVLVFVKERQDRFGEPGEIPAGDTRLVAIGISADAINRAVDRCRVIAVHESAWPIINGFTRDRHVVGVHDAMDETGQQPLGDEVCLAGYDLIKKTPVGVRCATRFGVMAGNDMVGELPDRLHVCADGEELKGADADVA